MYLNRQGATEGDEHSELVEQIMKRYDAMSPEEQDKFFEKLKRLKIKKAILGSEEASL